MRGGKEGTRAARAGLTGAAGRRYDAADDAGEGCADGWFPRAVRFMLAAFTGYEIIGRVPVILHTPLMSGSNFVHGIVLVGAMVVLGRPIPAGEGDRLPRRAARRRQRRRRLRGHRAHARDVQVVARSRRPA
jgi:hypothetical protein